MLKGASNMEIRLMDALRSVFHEQPLFNAPMTPVLSLLT